MIPIERRNRIARGGNTINQMVVLLIRTLLMENRKYDGRRRANRSVNLPALLLFLQQINQYRTVSKMLLYNQNYCRKYTAPGIPPGRTIASYSLVEASFISASAVYFMK